MAGTGLATANLAGLNRSVFQGTREPLSPSFAVYPTFAAHFYLALLLLAGFIVLHVLAAPYHHFARMDRLPRRMWFERRVSRPSDRRIDSPIFAKNPAMIDLASRWRVCWDGRRRPDRSRSPHAAPGRLLLFAAIPVGLYRAQPVP
jgi:hypothetical protein